MAKADTLSVTFELTAADLDYFRDRLARAREKHAGAEEAALIHAATSLVTSVRVNTAPAFVRARIDVLKTLIDMLEDGAWRLEGEHRGRVLNALTYFVETDDLIPDRTPGVGYLDDAIMIELVAEELAPEIEAYKDFIAFCAARAEADAAFVEEQRDELQRRMRRVARANRRMGMSEGRRAPLSLW
jgi:uncharacterized membrane protein YkvA (DUF1232 family)